MIPGSQVSKNRFWVKVRFLSNILEIVPARTIAGLYFAD